MSGGRFPKALADAFPFLEALSPEGAARLRDGLERRRFAPKTLVLEEDARCESLLLVESGHLRVFKTSESGREITLYRVRPGDSCVISMSCVLSGSRYPAHVSTPEACEAVAVPADTFRELFQREPAVQGMVVAHLSSLLSGMMSLVAEVAFRKMDQRLAGFLLEEGRAAPVRASHEEIATHLGTAREVVSRLLENFKDDELIALERRQIRVLDADALERVRGDLA